MKTILIICLLLHLLGGIIGIAIMCKIGIMKEVALYEDGIRPTDIIFLMMIGWEIALLIFIFEMLNQGINDCIKKHYEKRRKYE